MRTVQKERNVPYEVIVKQVVDRPVPRNVPVEGTLLVTTNNKRTTH